jgi:hypothetical protein
MLAMELLRLASQVASRAPADEPDAYREVTVVLGVRAGPDQSHRERNALACLLALVLQDLDRRRYRIAVVEQDKEPRLERALGALANRYLFAYNPGRYNRGWAFNIGARDSAGRTAFLCLIDADLLVPTDFLRRCLAAMKAGRSAVTPFQDVLYLDAESSERAIAERFTGSPAGRAGVAYGGLVKTACPGGCIWVDASIYQQVGGHDERFRGWGREDVEFWHRLARSTSITRLPGRLLHLYHPRPSIDEWNSWQILDVRVDMPLGSPAGCSVAHPIGDLGLYVDEWPSGAEIAGPSGVTATSWGSPA